MREELIEKARALNDIDRKLKSSRTIIWTAEGVGKALWTKAMLSAYSSVYDEDEVISALKAVDTTAGVRSISDNREDQISGSKSKSLGYAETVLLGKSAPKRRRTSKK